MIGEVLPFSVQFKATNQMIGSISDLGTRFRDSRFSVFCRVRSMLIKSPFAVGGREHFENSEKAGNAHYSPHDVVHVR